jgi:hypothetical protein
MVTKMTKTCKWILTYDKAYFIAANVSLLQKCKFTVKSVLLEGKGCSPMSWGLRLGLSSCAGAPVALVIIPKNMSLFLPP